MATPSKSSRASHRGRGQSKRFPRSKSRGRDSRQTPKKDNKASNLEMKFALQGSGRPTATFASVKEHLQLYLQTQLERGDNVVKSIEAMELIDMAALWPKRIAPKETNKDLRE